MRRKLSTRFILSIWPLPILFLLVFHDSMEGRVSNLCGLVVLAVKGHTAQCASLLAPYAGSLQVPSLYMAADSLFIGIVGQRRRVREQVSNLYGLLIVEEHAAQYALLLRPTWAGNSAFILGGCFGEFATEFRADGNGERREPRCAFPQQCSKEYKEIGARACAGRRRRLLDRISDGPLSGRLQ